MSLLNLDKVDAAPVLYQEFDAQLLQWLWVLVDTLNEDLLRLEGAVGYALGFTAAELADMNTNPNNPKYPLQVGVFLYDLTNNVYVGKVVADPPLPAPASPLVKFTTAIYP